MKVRVVGTSVSKQRMTLSFRLTPPPKEARSKEEKGGDAAETDFDAAERDAGSGSADMETGDDSSDSKSARKKSNGSAVSGAGGLVPGSIVSGVVRGVSTENKEELLVDIDGLGVKGVLSANHLTDHPTHVLPLLSAYSQPGLALPKLCVLQLDKNGAPILTMKPSLLGALGVADSSAVVESNNSESKADDAESAEEQAEVVIHCPKSHDELVPQMLLQGYVKSVTDFGVFVGFLGKLTGLAPRAHLCDHFVTSPADHFSPGQTVRARVVEVNPDAEKFIISLKPSQVSSNLLSEAGFIRSFFAERSRIEQHLIASQPPADAVDWSKFAVGTLVQGRVAFVKDVGAFLDFDASASAVPEQKASKKKRKGSAAGAGAADMQTGAETEFRPASQHSAITGLCAMHQIPAARQPAKTGKAAKSPKSPKASGKKKGKGKGEAAAAAQEQKGGNLLQPNEMVKCRVLDINRAKRILDVSLKDQLSKFPLASSTIFRCLASSWDEGARAAQARHQGNRCFRLPRSFAYLA